MSSFFAIVTPLTAFDGQPGHLPSYGGFPGLPGQLPVFPPTPGIPTFPGQLPTPGGPFWPPNVGIPPFPGQLPMPGGDTPGNLPAPGQPGSPGHLPSEPPTTALPTGYSWAYSPRYGWTIVVLPGTPHPSPG